MLETVQRFRDFKPYLQSRLAYIRQSGRDVELQGEVDDIEFYLSVMTDILADETHGVDQLRSFIDKIHEMDRKNPLPDSQPTKKSKRSLDNVVEAESADNNNASRCQSPEALGSDGDGGGGSNTNDVLPTPTPAPQPGPGPRIIDVNFDTWDGVPATTRIPYYDDWSGESNTFENSFTRRESDKDVDVGGGTFGNSASSGSSGGRGPRDWLSEDEEREHFNAAQASGRGFGGGGWGRGMPPRRHSEDYLQRPLGRGRGYDSAQDRYDAHRIDWDRIGGSQNREREKTMYDAPPCRERDSRVARAPDWLAGPSERSREPNDWPANDDWNCNPKDSKEDYFNSMFERRPRNDTSAEPSSTTARQGSPADYTRGHGSGDPHSRERTDSGGDRHARGRLDTNVPYASPNVASIPPVPFPWNNIPAPLQGQGMYIMYCPPNSSVIPPTNKGGRNVPVYMMPMPNISGMNVGVQNDPSQMTANVSPPMGFQQDQPMDDYESPEMHSSPTGVSNVPARYNRPNRRGQNKRQFPPVATSSRTSNVGNPFRPAFGDPRLRNKMEEGEESKPPKKLTKLQELRKRIEKEGLHKLGRPAGKKHSGSCEETIIEEDNKKEDDYASEMPIKKKGGGLSNNGGESSDSGSVGSRRKKAAPRKGKQAVAEPPNPQQSKLAGYKIPRKSKPKQPEAEPISSPASTSKPSTPPELSKTSEVNPKSLKLLKEFLMSSVDPEQRKFIKTAKPDSLTEIYFNITSAFVGVRNGEMSEGSNPTTSTNSDDEVQEEELKKRGKGGGNKRKPNATRASPRKRTKKAGPVTRAQATKKNSKKATNKPIPPPSEESSETELQRKAAETREKMTTLMLDRLNAKTIGRNDTTVNTGLGKVKIECDFVAAVKAEPEEPEDSFLNSDMVYGDDIEQTFPADPLADPNENLGNDLATNMNDGQTEENMDLEVINPLDYVKTELEDIPVGEELSSDVFHESELNTAGQSVTDKPLTTSLPSETQSTSTAALLPETPINLVSLTSEQSGIIPVENMEGQAGENMDLGVVNAMGSDEQWTEVVVKTELDIADDEEESSELYSESELIISGIKSVTDENPSKSVSSETQATCTVAATPETLVNLVPSTFEAIPDPHPMANIKGDGIMNEISSNLVIPPGSVTGGVPPSVQESNGSLLTSISVLNTEGILEPTQTSSAVLAQPLDEWKCVVCSVPFTSKKSLKDHVERDHQKEYANDLVQYQPEN